MKKLFVIYFSFFVAESAFTQDKECLEDVGDKMCLVSTEGKFGILNKKGDYIVPAYFDTIEVFGSGFIVKQSGKCGVFDRKGRIIIPIEFAGVKCIGDCENEFLFEVIDIGIKSICVTKELDKVYGYTKISPLLIGSTFEISIKDWFAYVQDVKSNGFQYNYGFKDCLPDTSKVESKLLPAYRSFIKTVNSDGEFKEIKTNFGFRSGWTIKHFYDATILNSKIENMMNFPVTGLTYKQVQRYTEWLTLIYRDKINKNDDLPYEISFRLPKMEEWEKMADAGLREEMKKNKCLDSLNQLGCMLMNFDVQQKCNHYEDYIKNSFGKGSSPVSSFFPDYNGIYGVYGNVAEMVYENGLAKGGSYFHPAKKAAWNETMEYEGAEPWLGFRVVAEFKAK